MNHDSGNINDFGMDTISLAGPLEARLQAVREAGFTQIMLAAKTWSAIPWCGGRCGRGARQRTARDGFQCCAISRAVRPLARLQDRHRKSMLSMCHQLGCRLLLICSSTSVHATQETEALVKDLRKLAMLAIPMNIRIAYEACPGGELSTSFPGLGLICQADMPNLGLDLTLFTCSPPTHRWTNWTS